MKIVDANDKELPWDGKGIRRSESPRAMGRQRLFGDEPGSALDGGGWFATGDVATIDPDGFMESPTGRRT